MGQQPLPPDPEQSAGLPPAARPAPFSARTRLGVLAVAGILAFLFLVRIASILDPFLWAIVVAYVLNPLVKALSRRTSMPRPAAVACVYLTGVGAIVLALSYAIPNLNAELTQLSSALPSIVRNLEDQYFGLGASSKPLSVAGFSIDVQMVARDIASSLNSFLSNLVGGTFSAVVGSIELIVQFLLFLIVTFYLVLDAPQIAAYFKRLIPAEHRDEVLDVAHRVNFVLSQYMRAQLVLIVIMSVASFIVLSVMGVHFAVVLAPIVGILEIFPIIGPFSAITLVTVIAMFSPPQYDLSHTSSAVIVAVAFFTLRQIEDYAVIPNVVGHAVKLHPALILFAVAAGTTFGGALGLFLAVPATAALKVLGSYLYQKLVPA